MSVRTDRDPLVIIRLVVASYGKIDAALQFDCIVYIPTMQSLGFLGAHMILNPLIYVQYL